MSRLRRAAAIFIRIRNRVPTIARPSAKIRNTFGSNLRNLAIQVLAVGTSSRAVLSASSDAKASSFECTVFARASAGVVVLSCALIVPTVGGGSGHATGPPAAGSLALICDDVLACGGDVSRVDGAGCATCGQTGGVLAPGEEVGGVELTGAGVECDCAVGAASGVACAVASCADSPGAR
jgi:hypothetical protein